MSPETITIVVAIIGTGIALAMLIVPSLRELRRDLAAGRAEAAADRRTTQAAMDAFRAQAEADREAFRDEVRRLGER